MTEARRLLERCQHYVEGHIAARAGESDREALNRVRSDLLTDIDAYLAQPDPAAETAVLVEPLEGLLEAVADTGRCVCGRKFFQEHRKGCAWVAANRAHANLSPAAEALLARVEALRKELGDAAITVHEDSLNHTLYPYTQHKGHFKDCPAGVCSRRRAALAPGEEKEKEDSEPQL